MRLNVRSSLLLSLTTGVAATPSVTWGIDTDNNDVLETAVARSELKELVVASASMSSVAQGNEDIAAAALLAKASTHPRISISPRWRVVRFDIAALRIEELESALALLETESGHESSLKDLSSTLTGPFLLTPFPDESLVVEPRELQVGIPGRVFRWLGTVTAPQPGELVLALSGQRVVEGHIQVGALTYLIDGASVFGLQENPYCVVWQDNPDVPKATTQTD